MKKLTLLLALSLSLPVLAGAPKLKRCTVRCVDSGAYQTCWFDDLPACGKRQKVCVDSSTTDCVPRMVDLGRFDPNRDGTTLRWNERDEVQTVLEKQQ